jgi:hypothetical protein
VPLLPLLLLLLLLPLLLYHTACAGRLIGELRSGGVSASTDPKQLSSQQVVRLHQLLHEVGAMLQVTSSTHQKQGFGLSLCSSLLQLERNRSRS